jgi:DNA-binding GntR family transcriptional regulator
LAGAVGLSLGTVPQTLDQLALDGVVARTHGRGTFVTNAPRAISDSWHFRFWNNGEADRLLPVYSRVLQRGVVRSRGSWSQYLGHDRRGYVRIQRRFNVDDRFLSYSDFYLWASCFAAMAKLPMAEIEGVNLKNVLSERFGTPTLYVSARPSRAAAGQGGPDHVRQAAQLGAVPRDRRLQPSEHADLVSRDLGAATEHKLDLTLHGLESPLDDGAQRSAPWI